MVLSQVLLAFYVGITTKPTPVWSTEPLRVLQDLNLLNPSLLIPTWFPVELSWLVLAQTLYMEMEAPPVPRTPLCCILPGPRGPIMTCQYAPLATKEALDELQRLAAEHGVITKRNAKKNFLQKLWKRMANYYPAPWREE